MSESPAPLPGQSPAAQGPLPLRYWRQHAHLTVPASSPDLIVKALERGTDPTAGLLDAIGITARDLAEALSTSQSEVAQLLERPVAAPAVVVDLEDGVPRGSAGQGLIDGVVAALAAGESRPVPPGYRPLRFVRLPGLQEPDVIAAVERLLGGLGRSEEESRLDGIVIPKFDHDTEADRLTTVLSVLSRARTASACRLLLMLESAAGLDSIGRLSPVARERLGGLIFGAVDHAADVGLPTIDFDHPVTLQARCAVVEAAARFGVPAIDGMTLAYPVVDRALDGPANRQRFLDRLQRVCADARGSFELGMTGKWVGHPAQLFAVELAHRSVFSAERVAAAARQITGYRAGVESGRGVTIVDGSMADRATERHAVGLLRRAAATGRFDPEAAAGLGVISASEAADLQGTPPTASEGRDG